MIIFNALVSISRVTLIASFYYISGSMITHLSSNTIGFPTNPQMYPYTKPNQEMDYLLIAAVILSAANEIRNHSHQGITRGY